MGTNISDEDFTLKMEEIRSFEMLVTAYKATERHNPQHNYKHEKRLLLADEFERCDTRVSASSYCICNMTSLNLHSSVTTLHTESFVL